ncbi:LCP family protein [Kineococcus sp. SYSU DK004]|uniref:LCP family protein n=1 Tax=Kineococcus sp. SYSU DK004 TaxID=3383125 RepID=UPI003D7E6525
MPTSTGPRQRPDLPGAGLTPRGRHASHQHGTAFRVLRVLGVGVLALALVAVGGGVFAWYRLQGNITAQDITGSLGERPSDESTADPTTGNDAVNILVMGSDTRELADGTGDRYAGDGDVEGARSDTTVLVHLAADRRSATLVSIPRDSVVQIPECRGDDGTTVPAERGMFNAAFTRGGAACTVKTVESLTGVYVDHYAVVDFGGFRSMVDALGGVTVCTPRDIDDPDSALTLTAGTHHVDGETALAYARVRHIGDGSDLSRIDRQQALMSSMVQEVTSSQMLLRPDRLYSFLDAATKSVTTDRELSRLSEVVGLAQSLQKMPPGGVQFLTVPNEPYPANPARVQWTAAADELWERVRTDTIGVPTEQDEPAATPTAQPSESSALLVPPDRIAVQVLNVGAPAGAAGAAAEALGAQGFQVTGTGDAEATSAAGDVLVRYGTDRQDSAATLAAALGGARTQLDASLGRSLVVELRAAVPVTDVRARVTGGPTAAPAVPAPEETFTGRVATDDICA